MSAGHEPKKMGQRRRAEEDQRQDDVHFPTDRFMAISGRRSQPLTFERRLERLQEESLVTAGALLARSGSMCAGAPEPCR